MDVTTASLAVLPVEFVQEFLQETFPTPDLKEFCHHAISVIMARAGVDLAHYANLFDWWKACTVQNGTGGYEIHAGTVTVNILDTAFKNWAHCTMTSLWPAFHMST